MLKEKINQGNLNSLEEYYEFYTNLKSITEETTLENLKKFFSNNKTSNIKSINSLVTFYNYLEIISIENNKVKLNLMNYNKINKTNLDKFNKSLLELLFDNIYLTNDKFLEIIEKINFISEVKQFEIHKTNIPLEFSEVRNLLIILNFWKYSSNKILLIINKEYNYLIKFSSRKFSLESLKKKLILQEEQGLIGEEFVKKYELERLNYKKEVKIISEKDVSAGYDIISYCNSSNFSENIFIEVKTYNSQPNFYWSINEIEVSKKLRDKYYLYLVNIKDINLKNYKPIIIKDPFKNVFNPNKIWDKKETVWNISLKK